MMIKAVLFDVDGVLIDTGEANIKFYQVLISHLGYKRPTREEILKGFKSFKEIPQAIDKLEM